MGKTIKLATQIIRMVQPHINKWKKDYKSWFSTNLKWKYNLIKKYEKKIIRIKRRN
jgi:hypothetical protein